MDRRDLNRMFDGLTPDPRRERELLEELLQNGTRRRRPMKNWKRVVVAVAACLILAVWAGVSLYGGRSALSPGTADLPKLPLSTEVTNPSGMGFEGYLAYDVSELCVGNLWRESDNLQTLPVYRNPVEYDRAGAPVGNVDLDVMRVRAQEVANRLGVDAEIRDNAPSEEEKAAVLKKLGEIPAGYFDPTEVTVQGDGVKITVGASLTAGIVFDPARELPEGYHFGYYASREDMEKVLDYLAGEYRTLLAMEDPQVCVTGGDYNIYGEQMYRIEAFDAAGDAAQRLINYSFNSADFSCDEQGRLWIVRLSGADLSQKVGDYPIITVEQAEKLLLEGRYITNVPYELPGEEYVKSVELLYLNGRLEEYFMPYYRFLVELPEAARENGLNTYGAYYVPAVEEAYLEGLPVWNGSFN